MMRLVGVVILGFLTAASASAQPRKSAGDEYSAAVKTIETTFEPADAKPGDTVTWALHINLAPGWHTYPIRQADANAAEVSEIKLPNSVGLKPIGEIAEAGDRKNTPNPAGGLDLTVLEGDVTWKQKFQVTADAVNGRITFTLPFRLNVCDDHHCLPQKKLSLSALLTITGGVAAPATTNGASNGEKTSGTIMDLSPPEESSDYRATMDGILQRMDKQIATREEGLIGFLLTAMFWGGVSLLTPCVFPMVPITVSFFLKQSEKNHSRPILLALVYCATIIAVLGTASITLLGFFTVPSINPFMNLCIGLLFVALALSLFGMYDLTLPSFLTRATASREGQGGVIGTIFMALTFTVVTFTCVAPFLGGFGGMAASGQYGLPVLILGAICFAATFAAPFFLLALFPSLIRKLPKSGGWLHSVKIVMGFVELAAALKFFRAAELIQARTPSFFTYDLVLGMWVALCALCGLYLVKAIQLGEEEPEPHVSVPRFLIGFLFLSLAVYLMPGLFSGGPDGSNQRPHGAVFAWIDSFLLPDPSDSTQADGLQWSGNLKRAIDDARADRLRTGKPAQVFIDFTGETCTNCKLNERDVFTKSEIKTAFQNYRLVQLFTDKVPDKYYPPAVRSRFSDTSKQQADADVNRWFQQNAFGKLQLPLYVILDVAPDGSISRSAAYVEGKINDVNSFVQFPETALWQLTAYFVRGSDSSESSLGMERPQSQ